MKRTIISLAVLVSMMFTTGCGMVKDFGEEMNGTHALKKRFVMGYCTAEADRLCPDPTRDSIVYRETMNKLIGKYGNNRYFEWGVAEEMGGRWDDFANLDK
ncbi:hypothetical protein AGMMS49532_10440 [Endomicrobiia bacterium]|nr:hypothetical protein AGMMS49532_10440 [Endomicrobiia bacterium]